ncbi:MAG: hypothetical protein R3C20_10265 [Planctomycetaceae bacterium]
MKPTTTLSHPSNDRLLSLDQFRGYTVAGMFLVNFLGGFNVTPAVLKHHHSYCSYADTIMPQFLFAVGFAFRLTLERRIQREGKYAAYKRVIQRLAGLALLSVVIYAPSGIAGSWVELVELGPAAVLARVMKREWFQTLMHIAATSLWILPVIRLSIGSRIVFLLFSAGIHIWLSWKFNFAWCNTSPNAIDGGPFGFLTWSIPAIAGTIACDLMTSVNRARSLVVTGLGLMLMGWALSCGTRFYDVVPSGDGPGIHEKIAEDPVVPGPGRTWHGFCELPFIEPPGFEDRQWNYWMMSQRAGTLTYLLFGAGFSLVVFAVFHQACDVYRLEFMPFRVLGSNALAGYVLHLMLMNAMDPFIPRDSPFWYVALALGLFFAIMWIFIGYLDRNRIHIRL